MTEAQTKALTKFAEQDLALARKNGVIAVIRTIVGNIEIRYTNRTYMIYDFNSEFAANGYAYYVGSKAGAVKWLVKNYEVIND